ncbi:MAG: VacJ family lipoprotein [Betaproteobacteria bacterium]|nr:VacJ family lipoprotein [Betaproteobacteria bacterium]
MREPHRITPHDYSVEKRPGWSAFFAGLCAGRLAISAILSLHVLMLAGCANVNPRDPLESYNRVVYAFNDAVDRNVLKPVSEGYKFVVPRIARLGIRNFFANLEDLWIGANNLLQLKVGDALSDWMRVVLNTTFGIAGLYDVASDAGLEKHNEDFGQTLGWWGLPSGPFFVIPLLGPSTFRDTSAWYIDAIASPFGAAIGAIDSENVAGIRYGLWTLNIINRRADALGATTLIDQAALDRYTFTRDAFLQRRRNLVFDGDPPREKDPDEESRVREEPSGQASAPVDDAVVNDATSARMTPATVQSEVQAHAK